MSEISAPTSGNVAQDFRLAMRRLAATVTILSTSDAEGKRFGMVATAVNSVTMDPPTLLVCVNQSASIHAPLRERERFCVNVLMDEHGALVPVFSGQKSGEERFASGDWRQDQDLPYLEGAQSNLFCSIESVTTVGTHSLVIARVTDVRVAEPVAPLLYADGRLAVLDSRSA
ncbi:MAG: hypothetical protein RJA36_2097 [Pseudomonadota bacterium]|jgi:flavin reductase (DIM6/NTAB) family NADH-FMN oxidoreductase RutF